MRKSFEKGVATVGLLCLSACGGGDATSAGPTGPAPAAAASARAEGHPGARRQVAESGRPKRPVLAGLLAFTARAKVPADEGAGAPDAVTLDEVGRNTAFCPAWVESPLYRPRPHTVRVKPGDDWIAAVENAAPGTEVVFAPGEYLVDELNVDIGDEVTLRGETGDPRDVHLKGGGFHHPHTSEGLTVYGRNVSIVDLSVSNLHYHAIFVKGDQGTDGLQVYNVRLFDTGTQHIKLTPGGARDGLVACSEIFYNPGKVQGDYIDAIDLHGAIDWTIRDNYIHDIEGEHNGCEVDVACGTYTSGPAILVWNQARGTVIERNVLENNYRDIALGLGRGHEGGVVRNNFIKRTQAGQPSAIELQTAHGALVAHNTVLAGRTEHAIEVRDSDGVQIVNNLTDAPIWDRGRATFEDRGNIVDATAEDFARAGDYHLSRDSRAIGAGEAVDAASEDIEGQARDADSVDVGCDQLN